MRWPAPTDSADPLATRLVHGMGAKNTLARTRRRVCVKFANIIIICASVQERDVGSVVMLTSFK